MRSSIILLLTLIIFPRPCSCQTKAKITDVDFHLEDRYIIINYNIAGSLPKEQMTIELKFLDENNKSIIPYKVSGDIGAKLFGDGPKTIIWDIVADQVSLSGNLKANVTIVSSKILYRGSSYAFLSLIVPGLGGYFVDKHKVRSVFTTVSALALLGYGLDQKNQANKYYSEYNASTLPSEIEKLYTKANDAQHKYYISTRVAAGIWALDIIWVTFKGIHNKTKAESAFSSYTGDGIRLYYSENNMQLGYTLSF